MASGTESGSFWMPPQSSTGAAEVDALFDFIYWLNVIFFVLITVGTIWFVIKYRRKSDDQLATSQIGHNTAFEAAWTFGPLAILIVVFVWGFRVFLDHTIPPPGAYEVNVTASKWKWVFDHANGASVTGTLHAPVGQPVKLIITSTDVLHSFFVPAFRTKMDAVPGRYTTLWFEATDVGSYQVFCTEYCGTSHSEMLAKVEVLEKPAFAEAQKKRFKTGSDGRAPAEWGAELFTTYGCGACHSVDGSRKVGPSMKGLFGKQEKIAGQPPVTVDEEYLRESVMDPNAKIVEGFAPSMPAFAGQIDNEEMNALIAYIKTLK